jgi:hypothetical protein
MRTVRYLTVFAAAALPTLVALLSGCPKKDTEETAPSATAATAAPTPTPTPTPTPSVTLTPAVDAGAADAAADADAGPKPTGGVSNLAKCCAAIEQNAKSAPPEQQGMYALAAAACRSGAIPAQFRNLAACK